MADGRQSFAELAATGALGVGKIDDFHTFVSKNLLITVEALCAFVVGAYKEVVVFYNAFEVDIAVFSFRRNHLVNIFDALDDFATFFK